MSAEHPKDVSSRAMLRVEKALEAIGAGGMVILTDDEDRENEGDLVMAAEHVAPESVNFMARHARGLICLSLEEERVRRLELPMMVDENRANRTTAFTISIEARQGVTTGISAADRARTIQAAVALDAKADDIVSPGHVFPLRARPGGVLQRSGHTEGSVDLARLAGCRPSAVICEIMNDDGTMARREDLAQFAAEHRLVTISIAELIEYRLKHERLIREVQSGEIELASGARWTARVYGSSVEDRQFMALTFGEYEKEPTLVRVHTASALGDIFGVFSPQRISALAAVRRIEEEGAGVILHLPRRERLEADLRYHLSNQAAASENSATPALSVVKESGADPDPEMPSLQAQEDTLREFGLGAQVLLELGLGRIRLLTNRPRRIAGLEGYGLEVVEQILLERA